MNGNVITIIEAEVWPDHIHMLIKMPPKYSVTSVMRFLKGKNSIMIYRSGEIWDTSIEIENFCVEDTV